MRKKAHITTRRPRAARQGRRAVEMAASKKSDWAVVTITLPLWNRLAARSFSAVVMFYSPLRSTKDTGKATRLNYAADASQVTARTLAKASSHT